MRFLTQTFLKGAAVILPIVAAVYIIAWLVQDTEAVTRTVVVRVIPEHLYVPGLGFLLVLAAVFTLGLLMYPWLTRKLLDGVDLTLRRIPLFATIYSPVRDLLDLFGGDVSNQLGEVVLVEIPGTGIETLGFVTRRTLADLPAEMTPEGEYPDERVVVYVQWSSQVGGYCFLVPRRSIRPVSMSVEEGMRWALTAGVSGPVDGNGQVEPPPGPAQ